MSMIKEFRTYDTEKIKYTIIQLKSQLLEHRFKFAQAELTNTGIFKETRKAIARLFTILTERKERLTTADWRIYSNMIVKKESLDSFKKQLEIDKTKKSIEKKEIKEAVEVELKKEKDSSSPKEVSQVSEALEIKKEDIDSDESALKSSSANISSDSQSSSQGSKP